MLSPLQPWRTFGYALMTPPTSGFAMKIGRRSRSIRVSTLKEPKSSIFRYTPYANVAAKSDTLLNPST